MNTRAIAASALMAMLAATATAATRVSPDPTFFLYGLLWLHGASPADLAEHRFTACYVGADTVLAREAAHHGLRVVARPRNPTEAAWFAREPALAAWFLVDDAAGEADLATCRKRLEMIRRVDTEHPTFAFENGRTVESDRPFAELLDVYSPYAYPFPQQTIDEYADGFLDELRYGVGRERLWTTVQCSGIYSQHRRFGLDARQQSTIVDGSQFRLIFWTAVSHGARGVFLWPEFGLFDRYGWGRERLAEAAIIGNELEVLGGHLLAGSETRGGATSRTRGIRAARIDRDGLSLVIVRRSKPGFELAIGASDDDAVVDVAGRADAAAWRLDGDGVRPLDAVATGHDLRVTLDGDLLDVVAFVLVDTSSRSVNRIGDAMRARAADVARFAVEAAEAHASSAISVIDHLTALGVVATAERDGHRARVESWRTSLADADSPTDRTRAARALRRELRGRLAELRDQADAWVGMAAPESVALRVSPFTLPEFYSSFIRPR